MQVNETISPITDLNMVCDIYIEKIPSFDMTRFMQAGLLVLTMIITAVGHQQVKNSAKINSLFASLRQGINPKYYLWFPIALQITYLFFIVHLLLFKFQRLYNITGFIWRTFHPMTSAIISIVYIKMRNTIKREKRRLASIDSGIGSKPDRLSKISLFGTSGASTVNNSMSEC